ncbi:MAG: chemotaxis protein CheD [Anaerolineae bacterium]
MAENLRAVSIGEMVVSDTPDEVLVAYGLGSCVAVCLYDPTARVGGMLHALLPNAPTPLASRPRPPNLGGRKGSGGDGGRVDGNLTKFVDPGVSLLIDSILQLGASRQRLIVHLCGGAQMLSAPGFNNSLNVGERNVLAAEKSLRTSGFRIRSRATGGRTGRTVRLYIASGQVTVKSVGQGEQPL